MTLRFSRLGLLDTLLPVLVPQGFQDLHSYFIPSAGYTRAVVDTLQFLKQPE
jgi:hypothetical protein